MRDFRVEEIIHNLDTLFYNLPCHIDDEGSEYVPLTLIQSKLELFKQTLSHSTKVSQVNNLDDSWWYCYDCGNIFLVSDENYFYNYCPYCGRKIDKK